MKLSTILWCGLLMFVVAVLVLGIIVTIDWTYGRPNLQERDQLDPSGELFDFQPQKIRVGKAQVGYVDGNKFKTFPRNAVICAINNQLPPRAAQALQAVLEA
jgi:hypothetical protein